MSENTLAHYEITALLGRGGMGEVHRARDTRLGRDVALKFLPDELARDPERLARFRREAKVLASLHHPSIAGIYGLEEVDNRVFLAMELAEGSDLSQRIARGPIPEEEALDIARQLAAGLENAHEAGVVHRDLKPANIKVGTDGKVKILDFGLARAFAGESPAEGNLENSPTITAAMSRAGVILGTAAYMSPEQARGRTVDRRADIWSFGAVVFEMLTGKRLFEEETISDTLAAVLRADIEWDSLPAGTSPGMRRLLERCLERDPLRRLRDIGEARVFLEAGARDSSLMTSSSSILGSSPGHIAEAGGQRGLPLRAVIAVAALTAVVGTMLGWQVLGRPKPAQVFNTTLPPPANAVFNLDSARPGPAALSPDGTMVAYSGRNEAGTVGLYLRRLDSPGETLLSGTDGAAYPFWSPDSRYIGFTSGDGKLKKVAIAGGPPVTLCAAENMKGGTWNRDGVILFAPDATGGIFRVPASGGEPVEFTTLDKEHKEDSHRHPRFLPGGGEYLYLARVSGAGQEHRVYVGSLKGGEPRLITTSQSAAEYSRGHLLTVREGILLASPFDPGSGKLGDGVPLVENILNISGAACGVYSANSDGMLLYQVAENKTEKVLEWVGGADAILGRVGDPGELQRPRVSPDGTQAVVEVLDLDTDTNDLWLVNLDSGLRTRFTFDPGNETGAEWTIDSRSVVYTATVDSTYRIMMRPVEGTEGASILFESDREIGVSGMSPDGASLMMVREDKDDDWNLYSLSIVTGELNLLVETDGTDYGGVISPDGRWLAYGTGKAAQWDVFVRPMSGGERRWQINRTPSTYPFWAPDGKTLYYIETSGDIQAVPVDGSGSTFRAGAPQPFAKVGGPSGGGIHVSLHPDGKKILRVAGDASDDETGYLRLVTDWQRGLAN